MSPTLTNRSIDPSWPGTRNDPGLVATAGLDRPGQTEIAIEHEPGGAANEFGGANVLPADNRRGQAGEAVVLPRFEMVLAVVVFELEEVGLHSVQVATGAECGEALVVELLPEGVPLVARQVVEVDHLDRSQLAERGGERGVQVALELLAERARQERVRLGLEHDSPQIGRSRFGIELGCAGAAITNRATTATRRIGELLRWLSSYHTPPSAVWSEVRCPLLQGLPSCESHWPSLFPSSSQLSLSRPMSPDLCSSRWCRAGLAWRIQITTSEAKSGFYHIAAQIPKAKGEMTEVTAAFEVRSGQSYVTAKKWQSWGYEIPTNKVGVLPALIIRASQVAPKVSKGRDLEFRLTDVHLHIVEPPKGADTVIGCDLLLAMNDVTKNVDRAYEPRLYFADNFLELTVPANSVKRPGTGDIPPPEPAVNADPTLVPFMAPVKTRGVAVFSSAAINGLSRYRTPDGKEKAVSVTVSSTTNCPGGIMVSMGTAGARSSWRRRSFEARARVSRRPSPGARSRNCGSACCRVWASRPRRTCCSRT